MFSTSKPGTSVSRLAALNLRRDQDADFTLYCQGTTILAHSFLLASTSEYFEMALSNDWLEKKEKKMELKECSAEALHAAVNFMYGINIPEGFKEYGELLHLADLFMMDNLKEVIEERLAKALKKSSYLEVSQLAELYSNTNLITKCGHFVFEEFGDSDEIKWEEMVKLPKVMAAFGKRAMKRKEDRVTTNDFKKKGDFASDERTRKRTRGVNKALAAFMKTTDDAKNQTKDWGERSLRGDQACPFCNRCFPATIIQSHVDRCPADKKKP